MTDVTLAMLRAARAEMRPFIPPNDDTLRKAIAAALSVRDCKVISAALSDRDEEPSEDTDHAIRRAIRLLRKIKTFYKTDINKAEKIRKAMGRDGFLQDLSGSLDQYRACLTCDFAWEDLVDYWMADHKTIEEIVNRALKDIKKEYPSIFTGDT